MKRLAVMGLLALSACAVAPDPDPTPDPFPISTAPLGAPEPALDPATAARNFGTVVARMEPSVEAECRARLTAEDCDFQIIVDTSPGAPPNAFQTRDGSGRPIIAFTVALIAEVRNTDELAFVMGHEAAHHILNPIPRQQRTAAVGSVMSGVLAAALGGDPTAIRAAQNLGAKAGALSYSKDFELEADALGTVLAFDAGFDPERGAAYFARIPDPGNSFLGTHPPNAQRIDIVRQTLAKLR